MRIIGGTLAGRILQPPMKKWPTRPTTDIAKEALYNILSNRIDFDDTVMLDLFGGTGAHILEFLSRGCPEATYVDSYPRCVTWIQNQLDSLGWSERGTVLKMDVARYIRKPTSDQKSYDLIFADPPYALTWMPQLPDMIINSGYLSEGGTLIIEHGRKVTFEHHKRCKEYRQYGQSGFSFFSL